MKRLLALLALAIVPSVAIAQTLGPVTASWSSATALNTAATISTSGYGLAEFSFNPSGSFTGGGFIFEVSDDCGTTWYPEQATTTLGVNQSTFTLSTTATLWQADVSGVCQFRIRLNPAISGAGTASVRVQVFNSPSRPGAQQNLGITSFGGQNAVLGVGAGTNSPRFALSNDSVFALSPFNLSQVGGSSTVFGGPVGTLGVGGTQADNAAITANPVIGAGRAQTSGSGPTLATSGNARQFMTDLDGALYVRQGSTQPFDCYLPGVAAALTQCQAAPGAGLSLYVTDIRVVTTTATQGAWKLQYGTGTNCATGTGNLIPGSAGGTWLAPITTATPDGIHFQTPVQVPAANALCALGVVTNTVNIEATGYIAP